MKRIIATGFIIIPIIVVSCDIYRLQKNFRLVVSERDYFYNYMVYHLKPFLENNDYKIAIIEADNTIEANRMVSRNEVDLSFINNHSVSVSETIGEEAGRRANDQREVGEIRFSYFVSFNSAGTYNTWFQGIIFL